ncbi:MAG: enoyl-CoA hydratase/isomerase family protein [Acidimicrobiia bacterium]|nr:enoyl-CoA hydratase/isomerase family protein [Acidimicrobiia bacterium]
MQAPLRSYPEIADTLRSPYAGDDLAPDPDMPLLAVDMRGHALGEEEARALGALPAVTVAVTAAPAATAVGLDAFDVVLAGTDADTERDLAVLSQRVPAHPQACVTLVRLLRHSARLDVVGGIFAESLAYSTLQAGPEFAHWLASRHASDPPPVNPVPLRVARDGADLHLTFCRPEIHNAFGFEVRDAVVEALQLAAADPSIETIVLDGEGPSFCSGGDLREFGTFTDPATAHQIRTGRSAGYWIHRVADRVHARIHGACVGSGIELPAFAAHVTAAPDLHVRLPEVGMGLIPGAGGTVSLPRRIGRQRTAWLALTGDRVDVATALEWGLVDEIG